jgi:hypothetical protein
MLFKNILISFCICVILTFISVSINRPNSSVFIPAFVLLVAGYASMCIVALLMNRLFKIDATWSFILSFLISYVVLVLVLWRINGSEFPDLISNIHKGPDFYSFLAPFILSNVGMLLWIIFKK